MLTGDDDENIEKEAKEEGANFVSNSYITVVKKPLNLLAVQEIIRVLGTKLYLDLKKSNEELIKTNDERVGWAKERKDLQNQLMMLTQKFEKATSEAVGNINHYKSKAKEYKSKTRQANLKLSQMATKLARLQAENIPGQINMASMGNEIKGSEFSGMMSPELRQIENEIAKTLNAHKELAGKMGV